MPRQVLPKTTYLITRRTLLRTFLLLPAPWVDQIVLYCLGVAAMKYDMALHALSVLSNHYHLEATDRSGRLPEFERWLNEFVAKAVNAQLGRWAPLWEPGSYNAVALETAEDRLDAATYTAVNPVKAALVQRADLWPGINILPSALGKTIKVKRPHKFFRANGPLPEEVELTFTLPPGFEDLTVEQYQELWQARIEAAEEKHRQEVHASGRRFLGRRAVLKQDRFASATSWERRRGLKPRLKCRNKWLRIDAIKRLKRFYAEYKEALERFCAGVRDVVFPAGTYWMRVHARVRCAPG